VQVAGGFRRGHDALLPSGAAFGLALGALFNLSLGELEGPDVA
jgi:hypothetical protein